MFNSSNHINVKNLKIEAMLDHFESFNPIPSINLTLLKTSNITWPIAIVALTNLGNLSNLALGPLK